VLYLQGASRFVDGSSHTADLLAKVITDNGGLVLPHDAVTTIDVEDHEVKAVTTKSGKVYHADTFISDIHPSALFQLIHGKAFTKAYTERVKQIPETISAFSLYLKMRPDSFPYINHSVYLMSRYDDIWNFSREDRPWPLGLLMMTPPVSRQQPWSSKVLVTVPMRFCQAEQWADTLTGRRGEDYEQWKQQRAREVLAMVEQRYPGFSKNIEGMVTASPLTIRDYYGTAGGGIAGFARDCHQILDSHLPVVTKVRNLLLTGQFVNLHGFCGVPLSAINTSEALLGLNTVVNKINDDATKR
jgi:all-trans-retinol 13,14-reductase